MTSIHFVRLKVVSRNKNARGGQRTGRAHQTTGKDKRIASRRAHAPVSARAGSTSENRDGAAGWEMILWIEYCVSAFIDLYPQLMHFRSIELSQMRAEERNRYQTELSRMQAEFEGRAVDIQEQAAKEQDRERARLAERQKVPNEVQGRVILSSTYLHGWALRSWIEKIWNFVRNYWKKIIGLQ